jgi:hypothetical protein
MTDWIHVADKLPSRAAYEVVKIRGNNFIGERYGYYFCTNGENLIWKYIIRHPHDPNSLDVLFWRPLTIKELDFLNKPPAQIFGGKVEDALRKSNPWIDARLPPPLSERDSTTFMVKTSDGIELEAWYDGDNKFWSDSVFGIDPIKENIIEWREMDE